MAASGLRHLNEVINAEQQAIAIYEAQVFWRPGNSGSIFREILAEERIHNQSIRPFAQHQTKTLTFRPLNILVGWLFGTLLSILPRKMCYQIHVWAENNAAKTYEKAAKKITQDVSPELFSALTHAALQEHQHAERFRTKLVKL